MTPHRRRPPRGRRTSPRRPRTRAGTTPEGAAEGSAPQTRDKAGPGAIAAAKAAIQQTRQSGGAEATSRSDEMAAADADAHPDDIDADNQGLAGTELLERELGARVIEEIRNT